MNGMVTRRWRHNFTPSERRTEAWPLANSSNRSQEDRDLYERRYQAICGYIRGEPLASLRQKWKLSRWEIIRLCKRCLSIHPDGRLWGFRALLPEIRVRIYTRIAQPKETKASRRLGFGGLLERLFCRAPEIRRKVYAHALRKNPGANEAWVPVASSHRIFIEACREAGVSTSEYPFNTKYLGIRSLASHLKGLFTSDLKAAVLATFGHDAARALKTGTGEPPRTAVTLPYQRVQFDGHRIDGIYTLLIPHPKGGFTEVTVDRPWLLVIQDVVTRAILGWHLSIGSEYTKYDVLKCVRNAIEPWTPRVLTIPNLTYHKDGGMPSQVFEKLQWAFWAELGYDNAKSHLCDWVRAQITLVLNAAVNPGPVKVPERRGILEALFRVLEERYLHRMPNTTGSDPKDHRRDNPEKAALRFHISLAHLEELLSVIISNYNGQPNDALSWRSPLEQLRFFIEEEGSVILRLRVEERARINLLAMQTTRTVRGSIKHGRRPYIQYEDERYTNEVLARSPDLIGTELTLIVNTDEIRSLRAFLPNGAELGVLCAMGKWSQTPHSLTTRKAANSRRALKVQHNVAPGNADPVHVLMDAYSKAALTSKRAATKYEQTRQNAGLPETFHPAIPAAAKEFEAPKLPISKLRSKQRSVLY
jgi:hypothetical protein